MIFLVFVDGIGELYIPAYIGFCGRDLQGFPALRHFGFTISGLVTAVSQFLNQVFQEIRLVERGGDVQIVVHNKGFLGC